jgi:hypothetical protein
MLDRLYTAFDALVGKHELFKVGPVVLIRVNAGFMGLAGP